MIAAITRTITKIVPTKPKPMAASIRLSSLDPWGRRYPARGSPNTGMRGGVVAVGMGIPRLEVSHVDNQLWDE